MKLDEIKKILEYYFLDKILIHISHTNGYFYNGFIKEIKDDKIIFTDKRVGDLPILFNQINRVEPFTSPGGVR